MWGWVSHITHILSCLHVRFHSQTVSNLQIALRFFFSCSNRGNRGQSLLLPGWWEETLFGKKGVCFPFSVPSGGRNEHRSRGWGREHPVMWAHNIPLWCVSYPTAPGLASQGVLTHYGAGHRARRTVAMHPCQPCPDLNPTPCHVIHLLSCTLCGSLWYTVKLEDDANPCFLEASCFVTVFGVCFRTHTVCRVLGKVLISTSKAFHLSHGGLHCFSLSYIENIFVVCNG